MHKFRELKVWQRSMAFTVAIYRESLKFPSDERFGLTSQIRRAVCGIPLNIAEGSGSSSNRDFCRFLDIALRQGYETMTAIDIARGLTYWPDDLCNTLQKEIDEIVAMLVGLMKSLGWPFKDSKQ
ncbi:MAG: four helix bundle protein [Anaerolineae bacterium]|nr:four helix bundle protein [Anaerolineae bacterium]